MYTPLGSASPAGPSSLQGAEAASELPAFRSPLLQFSSAKRPRTSEAWRSRNPYQEILSSPVPASAPVAEFRPPSVAASDSADLYEYLAKRHETQASQEEELTHLRAQVTDMKRKLMKSEQEQARTTAEAHAKASRWRRDEEELENALRAATSQAKAASQRCEQLEQRAAEQRAAAVREEQLLREKLQEGAAAAATAERELAMVQAKLSKEKMEAKDGARRAEAALRQERELLAGASQALEHAEGRLGRIEAELAEVSGRAAAAERKCASLEALQAKQQGEGDGNVGHAVELQVLRRELSAAQAEAAQVKILRQHMANVDLLREQLASEGSRCRRLEQELEVTRAAQLKLVEAEAAAALWQSAAAALGPDCRSPEDLPRCAAELQRESLKAIERQGTANREEWRLKLRIEDLEAEIQSLKSKAVQFHHQADSAEVSLAREQRKVQVLESELNGLRRVLASYEQESQQQQGVVTQGREANALRLGEAEGRIQLLSAQVAQLEGDLSAKAAALGEAQKQEALLHQKLADSEVKARRADSEAARLANEVALLNERVGRGEFDRAKTKVVHFISNPESIARKETEEATHLSLAAERDSLAAQVLQLQADLAALRSSSSATPAAAAPSQGGGLPASAPHADGGGSARQIAVLEAEKVVLQRQVGEVEKRERRLKEVFRDRIQAFREACYQLFGYRVDMASESSSRGAGAGAASSFVLRPAKADCKDDHLMFRFTQAGGMEMLDTPFTIQPARQREVQTFIGKFGSIPAFTANLTMELFQKQTQC
mmetsp:Transcript_3177/g.9010  ORF Transcript_3177/g.9010 Transcript_3177/m.9010 type:complete len:779 (-) Transcript_3177:5355-7691(-)